MMTRLELQNNFTALLLFIIKLQLKIKPLMGLTPGSRAAVRCLHPKRYNLRITLWSINLELPQEPISSHQCSVELSSSNIEEGLQV